MNPSALKPILFVLFAECISFIKINYNFISFATNILIFLYLFLAFLLKNIYPLYPRFLRKILPFRCMHIGQGAALLHLICRNLHKKQAAHRTACFSSFL